MDPRKNLIVFSKSITLLNGPTENLWDFPRYILLRKWDQRKIFGIFLGPFTS